LRVDWAEFVDAWRAGYRPAMNKVLKGELPWITIDGLNRLILNDLLKQFQIEGLSLKRRSITLTALGTA
jgi:2-haloacid dehalogenase